MKKKPDTCKWVYDQDCCYYETECGGSWTMIDGNLKDNEVVYCPKCGGKIVCKSEEIQEGNK